MLTLSSPISTIFNAQVSSDISVAKEELGMTDQMLSHTKLFNVASANLYRTGLKLNSLATHHDYLWVEYEAYMGENLSTYDTEFRNILLT